MIFHDFPCGGCRVKPFRVGIGRREHHPAIPATDPGHRRRAHHRFQSYRWDAGRFSELSGQRLRVKSGKVSAGARGRVDISRIRGRNAGPEPAPGVIAGQWRRNPPPLTRDPRYIPHEGMTQAAWARPGPSTSVRPGRSLLEPPRQLRSRNTSAPRTATSVRISIRSPNIAMKLERARPLLRRVFRDATLTRSRQDHSRTGDGLWMSPRS